MLGDSSREFRVIARGDEQLDPEDVEDHELAVVQRRTEATRIAFDLVRSRNDLGAATKR